MIDKQKVESAIYELIKAIGENPERGGLKETPSRVARMYEEIFSGMETLSTDSIKVFKETEQENAIIMRGVLSSDEQRKKELYSLL